MVWGSEIIIWTGYEDPVGWNSVYSDQSTNNMDSLLIGGDTTLFTGTAVTNDEVERNSEPIYGQSHNCITRYVREIMSSKTAPSSHSAREWDFSHLIEGEEPHPPGHSNITETWPLSDETPLYDNDQSLTSIDTLFENIVSHQEALDILQDLDTPGSDISEVIGTNVPGYMAPESQLEQETLQQTTLQQAPAELIQLQTVQLQPELSQMQPELAQMQPEPSQLEPALLLPVVVQQPPMQQVSLQEVPLQQISSSLQEPVKKRRPGRPRKQPTNAESTQQKLDTNQEVFTERRVKSESIKRIHGMVLKELESGALDQELQFQEDGLLRKRPRKALSKMEQGVNFDSPQDPHLAKRMKNNVASKKSREKSKNQIRLAEQHCDALEKRHRELVNMKVKLEAALEAVNSALFKK